MNLSEVKTKIKINVGPYNPNYMDLNQRMRDHIVPISLMSCRYRNINNFWIHTPDNLLREACNNPNSTTMPHFATIITCDCHSAGKKQLF